MKALLKAIFECKKEIPAIEKKAIANIGTYKYKYADLADVQTAIKAAMEKHGLIFSHNIEVKDGKERLQTTLFHVESMEVLGSSLEIPLGKFQERGASITYAKRYNIGCLLDLVLDEDIDGPKDEGKKTGEPKPQSPPQGAPKDNQPGTAVITHPQLTRLFAIGSAHGWSETKMDEFIKRRFNLDSKKKLQRFQYDFLISTIEKDPLVDKAKQ